VTLQARIDPSDNTLVNIYEEKNGTDGFGTGDLLYYTLSLEDLTTAGDGTITGNLDSWQFNVVNAPSAPDLVFDFDDLPSGSNLFGSVAEDPAGPGILITGRDIVLQNNGKYANTSDVIFTSQGGINATIGEGNQMVDAGEGIYFTIVNDIVDNFLSGFEPGGLTQTEADFAANIQYDGGLKEVTGASLGVSQIQANSLAEMKLTCFNLAGAPEQAALITASGTGTVQNITRVFVYDETGALIEDTGDLLNFNDTTVTVDLAGNTAVVGGLDAGYVVEWETAAAFDQVLVEGVSGKFDLGFFGIAEAQQVPDHFYDFTVRLTDADNDFVSDTFRVVIDNPLV
jgi:hypothetical protein